MSRTPRPGMGFKKRQQAFVPINERYSPKRCGDCGKRLKWGYLHSICVKCAKLRA